MPTDTALGGTRARNFALRFAAWSLGLFGLQRLAWVEAHAVLPLTELQARLAVAICGTPALAIEATLACSGADAAAVCLGAILAYPASWRMRLAGAGGGLGLLLALNTLRIGTLGRVAGSPRWFGALHVYVWPAVLTLAIATYVFAWMRFANQGPTDEAAAALPVPSADQRARTRRFLGLTAILIVLFTLASPLYLESAGVLFVAAFIARAAAAAFHVFGIESRAVANVLWTPRGGFMVTQECIATPLVPLYVAAVLAYAGTWRRSALGLLATLPIFVVLGIARLLVVAVPAALVDSPVFLVHAFYQIVLGAVVVWFAALWRHEGRQKAAGPALLGMLLGLAFVQLLGAPYTRLVERATEMIARAISFGFAAGTPLDDPQGAIALLPAFQVGLLLALWVASCVKLGWRRLIAGLVLLELMQIATLVALHVLASHTGIAPHVRDVRAWAVVGPLLVLMALVHFGRSARWQPPVAAPVGDIASG